MKNELNQAELSEKTVNAGLASIAQLGQEFIKEQRRARRWKWITRLLFALVLLAIFVVPSFMKNKLNSLHGGFAAPHVAIIMLEGLVMPGAEIDADQVVTSLHTAFTNDHSTGILLQINSPGGSPVQAERIYDEIVRLKALYPDKKVVAVIEDIGASAAYFIASAADEIVASKASLIGSIGVIVNSFGVVDAMQKLGIERRLITAGENKAMLDPFSPKDVAQEAKMQRIVDQVHQQFIAAVKNGRKERLVENDELFSGMVWNGSEAIKLGLIDHIGSVGFALREIFETDTWLDYTERKDWFKTFTRQMGTSIGEAFSRVMTNKHVQLN